jgi:hypothetical protein
MAEAHYRVNSPPVVLETVDEETIIVNLDTGSYYDLTHSGGRLLAALDGGAGLDGAIDAVAAAYAVERAQLAGPAQALVAQLADEGIVVAIDGTAAANGSVNGATPPAKPYEAPALSKYTDMQELLLLDPVHEVDGAGWPNKV